MNAKQAKRMRQFIRLRMFKDPCAPFERKVNVTRHIKIGPDGKPFQLEHHVLEPKGGRAIYQRAKRAYNQARQLSGPVSAWDFMEVHHAGS